MKKRIIAIGDIHGEFGLLMDLMGKINFDPDNDLIIVLGDAIDRGPMSRSVVRYLKSQAREYPDSWINLYGNHEDMAEHGIKQVHAIGDEVPGDYWGCWMINGGPQTIDSWDTKEEAYKEILDYCATLRLEWETETHRFAHASWYPLGLNPAQRRDAMLWAGIGDEKHDKPVIVGHMIQRNGMTKFPNGNICIDSGACCFGVLTGYDVLNDKQYVASKE